MCLVLFANMDSSQDLELSQMCEFFLNNNEDIILSKALDMAAEYSGKACIYIGTIVYFIKLVGNYLTTVYEFFPCHTLEVKRRLINYHKAIVECD